MLSRRGVCLCLACILLVWSRGLYAQIIDFGPAEDYKVGWAPVDIVAGDFNGDGKLDLLTVSSPDLSRFPQISLLFGNGDGTFQQVRYAATPKTAGPSAVVAGDFNGDGKLDVAIAAIDFMASSHESVIWVLLGNGDGTFQPAVSYPFQAVLTGLAAGYLNGDNKLDLVAVDRHDGNVFVLLGKGDGTFVRRPSFTAGAGANSVAVGDFNLDGKADLALANPKAKAMLVALGNGDGSFQPLVSWTVPDVPLFSVIADLNKDGYPDIATGNWDNTVSVLLGTGNGAFQPAVTYSDIPTPSRPVVADFNGDGWPDLVVANNDSANTITVLPGIGYGAFGAPLTFYINHSLWGMTPIEVVAVDLNGDGKPDVGVADYDFAVGSNHHSYVSVFLNVTL